MLAWVTVLSAPAYAIYVRVVTEDVPVARLIENLTRQAAARPGDGQLQWALARAHAMAASDPSRSVPAGKDGRIWHGYSAPFAPFDPVAGAAGKPSTTARQHLDLAITHHRRAVVLLPEEPAVRLGLAWGLQQAGQTADAVAEYRATIEAAWKDEGQRTTLGLGGRTVVSEAASYLKPLLDPVRDRQEIRTLDQRVAKLATLPVPITPIVVDLAGGGSASALIDRDACVSFDLEGRGVARAWEWITPRAAWLVWDPNQSRRVSSGRQLFGSVTFLIDWRTGYDALASLDDDGDGWLRGTELRGLALWHDRDGDAVSAPDEVRPVSWHRIDAIATRGDAGVTPRVAAWARHGVRYADGSTAPTYDIVLHAAASVTTTRRREPAAPAGVGSLGGRQAQHDVEARGEFAGAR
jgi:hypothetical protein